MLPGLDRAVEKMLPLATTLFDEIGRRTTVDGAVCRTPFGAGEQIAWDLVSAAARDLGFSVTSDLANNLHINWPAVPDASRICLVGSHLDSVPRGGNFDGLAGVLAGLVAAAALRETGARPTTDITVLGMRGEENAWFSCQHIGSRIALGLFDPKHLDDAKRSDTGLSLGHHMAEAGIDLVPIRSGRKAFEARDVRCFLELHIEQGPILEDRDLAVGVVTGIRGNVRHRRCTSVGAYGHAGAVPRHLRQDAVFALAELITEMDGRWADRETLGQDLVITIGQVATDPAASSVTVIPGEATFSFEARSHSTQVLTEVDGELRETAGRIGAKRGVSFDFDRASSSPPVLMDAELRGRLLRAAADLGIETMEIASGGGHDAADFAEAGIRSAMIFVRSANGSHNPSETMSVTDFADGTRVLADVLASEATASR